jgi:hypothetical protein
MVRPDSVVHLCQEIDGEWYAIITTRSDGKDAEPIIAIAGPFADREEASDHNTSSNRLAKKGAQAGVDNSTAEQRQEWARHATIAPWRKPSP